MLFAALLHASRCTRTNCPHLMSDVTSSRPACVPTACFHLQLQHSVHARGLLGTSSTGKQASRVSVLLAACSDIQSLTPCDLPSPSQRGSCWLSCAGPCRTAVCTTKCSRLRDCSHAGPMVQQCTLMVDTTPQHAPIHSRSPVTLCHHCCQHPIAANTPPAACTHVHQNPVSLFDHPYHHPTTSACTCRVGDIWRGLWAQRLLREIGGHLALLPPTASRTVSHLHQSHGAVTTPDAQHFQ
jgi:hypothetical protein